MDHRSPDCRQMPADSLPGISRLCADYLTDPGRLNDFYRHRWNDPGAFRQAAEQRLQAYVADRTTLTAALRTQNRAWECGEETLRNIDLLERPDAVTVVTGQQAGIIGGPAFTVYKALTAVRLAADLQAEWDTPVVPVFWMVSDDHDTAEIDHTALPGPDGTPAVIRYAVPAEKTRDSVLGLSLEKHAWDGFEQSLRERLPETAFTSGLVDDMICRTYSAGTGLVDAFARLTHRLFRKYGIIIVDPAREGLKRMGEEVFRRELADPLKTTALVARAGETLAGKGYHGQIRPNPSGVNLLIREHGIRHKILNEDGMFRYGNERISAESLRQRLGEDPDAFSTGVVLRPILQDTLLPTVAYVGGPGEVAYFAQLKEVYSLYGLPMPVIVPRNGFTLVERSVARIMEKHGLTPKDMFRKPDDILADLLRSAGVKHISEALDDLARHTTDRLEGLLRAVMDIDPTLEKPVRKTSAGTAGAFASLEKKVVAAATRSQDTLTRQITRAAGHIFPGGIPQERVYTIFWFLNQTGPDLLDRLYHEVRPGAASHTVLYL